MCKNLLTDGMMDSGLGRTLSSYGRPKIRSRSEERISTIMPNGHGPMISVRSEAFSEPTVKTHRNHKTKCANYCAREDSVLLDIPVPRNRLFSHQEHGNYDTHDDCNRQKIEKYKRKEKSVENQNMERNEEAITKLQVSPLNSNRLQPTRHRTKSAVLTILDNGEVCIEFVKRRNGSVRREEVQKY